MGQFRRVRRRTITAFTPHKIDLKKWRWWDFTCLVIALVLLVVAVASLIVTSYYLHKWTGGRDKPKVQYTNYGDPKERQKKEAVLELDIELSVSLKPLRSLCIYQIVVEVIIILVMIFICLWLRYLRNMCVLLFVIILLVIIIILFVGIAVTALYKRSVNTDSRAFTEVYHHITKHLSNGGGDKFYLYKVFDFQATHGCCGVHDYKDWKQWNLIADLKKDSVPNSCCKDATSSKGSQALINPCQNDDMFSVPEKSRRFEKLNKDGCGYLFKDKHRKNFSAFVIYAIVMAAIYVLFLVFFFFLGYKLYESIVNRDWDRTDSHREMADEMDNDLIPGTPAKSMMSDDENTFYAP